MRILIIKVYIIWQSPELQSQTKDCIKALYDIFLMYMYINNLLRKGLKTTQKIFRIFVDFFSVFLKLRVFIVNQHSKRLENHISKQRFSVSSAGPVGSLVVRASDL